MNVPSYEKNSTTRPSESTSATPSGLPGGFRAAVAEALAALGYAVAGWEVDGVSVVAPAGGEVQPHGPAASAGQYVGLANLYRRAKHDTHNTHSGNLAARIQTAEARSATGKIEVLQNWP